MGYLFGILGTLFQYSELDFIRQVRIAPTVWINIVRFLGAVIIMGLLAAILSVWSVPSSNAWLLIGISIIVETVVMYCYVTAFQISDQKTVGPLFGSTVIFLIPLGILFLGEHPSLPVIIGIAISFIGTLLIGLQNQASITKMFFSKGSLLMMIASVLGSCSIVLAKITMTEIHPLVFGFSIMSGLLILNLIFAVFWRMDQLPKFHDGSDNFFVAFFFGFGQVFHYMGLHLIFASVYIVLKRMHVLFDVLRDVIYGKGIKFFSFKIQGAILMLIGIILIFLG